MSRALKSTPRATLFRPFFWICLKLCCNKFNTSIDLIRRGRSRMGHIMSQTGRPISDVRYGTWCPRQDVPNGTSYSRCPSQDVPSGTWCPKWDVPSGKSKMKRPVWDMMSWSGCPFWDVPDGTFRLGHHVLDRTSRLGHHVPIGTSCLGHPRRDVPFRTS